jgi:hypothetical protein
MFGVRLSKWTDVRAHILLASIAANYLSGCATIGALTENNFSLDVRASETEVTVRTVPAERRFREPSYPMDELGVRVMAGGAGLATYAFLTGQHKNSELSINFI